jgi:SAM-dependent methyltransferase
MPFSLNLPYPVCYPLTRFVRWLRPPYRKAAHDQAAYFDYQYQTTEHMRRRFMEGFSFDGAVLLDVGSGLGGRAPYWLEHGARRVVCIDVNRAELEVGRAILADKFPALKDRVDFLHPDEVTGTDFADVGILFDVFEHLVDPATVLRQCHAWLRPGGRLWIGSIGWYNYMASHCLGHIPIPWCQVLFSQRAIIRTIRSILHRPGYVPSVWELQDGLDRWDKVTTLKDRPGEPLNLLSLRVARKELASSPLQLSSFRVHGFSGRKNPAARAFSLLAKVPLLRELFHSYYTAVLTKPAQTAAHRGGPDSPARAAVAAPQLSR